MTAIGSNLLIKLSDTYFMRRNIILRLNGKKVTLPELSKEYGLSHGALYRRIILNGMTVKEAIKKGHLGIKSREQLLYSLKKRLLSKYKIDPITSCWNFTGSLVNGYGCIGFGLKNLMKAHRASYLVHFGEIPDNLDCCHTCDNPTCINPDHLFLGTAKENMEDMYSKGRRKHTGDSSPNRKLSEKIVSDIRIEYNGDGVNQTELANKYNTSQSNISNIVRNNIWAQ